MAPILICPWGSVSIFMLSLHPKMIKFSALTIKYGQECVSTLLFWCEPVSSLETLVKPKELLIVCFKMETTTPRICSNFSPGSHRNNLKIFLQQDHTFLCLYQATFTPPPKTDLSHAQYVSYRETWTVKRLTTESILAESQAIVDLSLGVHVSCNGWKLLRMNVFIWFISLNQLDVLF